MWLVHRSAVRREGGSSQTISSNYSKSRAHVLSVRVTTEYSANGSFPDHNHAAVSACIFTRSEAPVIRAEPGQKNIWISLTAD